MKTQIKKKYYLEWEIMSIPLEFSSNNIHTFYLHTLYLLYTLYIYMYNVYIRVRTYIFMNVQVWV